MNLLLAVDPPELNDAVIAEVAARPWPANTAVTVLSVVEPVIRAGRSIARGGLSNAAQDAVRSAAEQLQSAGLDAKTLVLVGTPEVRHRRRGRRHGRGLHHHRLAGNERPGAFSAGQRGGGSGAIRAVLGGNHAASDGSETPAPADEDTAGGRRLGSSQAAAQSIAERPWPAGSEFRVLSVAETSVPLLQVPYFSPSAMEKRARRGHAAMPRKPRWPPKRS